jgi:hypothetical protein
MSRFSCPILRGFVVRPPNFSRHRSHVSSARALLLRALHFADECIRGTLDSADGAAYAGSQCQSGEAAPTLAPRPLLLLVPASLRGAMERALSTLIERGVGSNDEAVGRVTGEEAFVGSDFEPSLDARSARSRSLSLDVALRALDSIAIKCVAY